MASTTQNQLFESFLDAWGAGTASTNGYAAASQDVAAALADPLRQMVNLVSGQGAQTTGSSAQAATGGGIGSTVEDIAKTFFESGFGIVPMIGGLLGLFGGGGSSTPPPLVKYTMPDQLSFEGADTGSGISFADYDQMGMPRQYDPGPAAAPAGVAGAGGGGAASSGGAAAPQITVNVQAMDSQSFLDRSQDIAQAVRQAMLNLSSINDVVNEL
jgi:hypothetical protein